MIKRKAPAYWGGKIFGEGDYRDEILRSPPCKGSGPPSWCQGR